MALLRRGSSNISNENVNMRLQREQAKVGAITVSLAWNDPSDLDLHAHVTSADGKVAHIFYRKKSDAGGVLDVDMHARDNSIVREPVENIYWAEPRPGDYRVEVELYKLRSAPAAGRGGSGHPIPFKVLLQREGEENLSVEGEVSEDKKKVVCFKWSVAEDGSVNVEEQALEDVTPARPSAAFVATVTSGKGKGKGKGEGRGGSSGSGSISISSGRRTSRTGSAARGRATASSSATAATKVKKLALKAKAKARAAADKEKAKLKAKAKAKAALAKAKAAKAKAKAKAALAKARAKAKAAKAQAAKATTKASKIATGKRAKELVFKGLRERTSTGLKKEHLVRNKFGKVVSAKKNAAGKTNKWAIATSRARQELGFSGFRPLRKGDEFYLKAKEILASL